MKRVLITIAAGLLLAIAGCKIIQSTDPNTGEVHKTYQVDTDVTDKIETVVTIVEAAAPFFGTAGIALAGILTGVLAAWRKVKPSLTQARTASSQAYATATALVTAIESFKQTNPDQWASMKTLIRAQLSKQGMDPAIIENIIAAIRGVPATA